MTNRSGQIFESRLLPALKTIFPGAYRRGAHGAHDRGDFGNVWPFVIQAKNRKEITLAKFMDDTEQQRKNDRARFGACIINRKNCMLGRCYVVMELDQWLELVNAWLVPERDSDGTTVA